MTGQGGNLPASVAARLLNRAKQTGDDYQLVLTSYCLERFLYRLGKSAVRERFVLKGAMLLRLWSDRPYRSTRDLDLLRKGDASVGAIRRDLELICAVAVEADGVEFDAPAARINSIRLEDQSIGIRAVLPARCSTARLSLQLDLGRGDSVWPAPQGCVYPVLLEFPAPNVLAYPRDTVVAEKLEAIVLLGDRNSRIKDFFDLHFLASEFEFDRATLGEAVRRTLGQRGTPVPPDAPIGLTPAFWENPSRPSQIRAFARRAGITVGGAPGPAFADLLGAFLLPILNDLRHGDPGNGAWKPGGPWH